MLNIIGFEIRDFVSGGMKDLYFAISGSTLYEMQFKKAPSSITDMMTKTIYRCVDLTALAISQSQCR